MIYKITILRVVELMAHQSMNNAPLSLLDKKQGVERDMFQGTPDRAQFRHLPQQPGIELYQAHIARCSFEPHSHDAFGIGTIDAGAERFRYRGAQHVAAQDSLVLMNPDELHTGQAVTDEGWRYRMIYIDPAQLEALTGEKGWWFTEVVRHDPRAAQQLSAVLAALWRPHDALACDGLIATLIDVLRPFARIAQPLAAEAAPRFDRVKHYLNDNYAQPVTLAQLAEVAALSPYHFLRRFKAEFHVTPHQMLMAIRLQRAKQMLCRGVPAAQVAIAVGLTDQAHLTRGFAQRYGITPVRYQKQVRPSGV